MRPSITHHTPTIQALQNHTRILSGNVSFGASNTDQSKNLQGWWAVGVVTPVAPNTDFAVTIGLGYIPQFFDVKSINANASVYKSPTPWTLTQAFFRCSVASVTVSLFIH